MAAPCSPDHVGSYREVYDLGHAVLKVDRFPGDFDANESEHALWRLVRRRKEAAHFARILRRNRDGSLVMERADCLLADTVPLNRFDPAVHLEPEVLAAFDRHHLIDIHPYNVGIFNGKQKIIDYQVLN